MDGSFSFLFLILIFDLGCAPTTILQLQFDEMNLYLLIGAIFRSFHQYGDPGGDLEQGIPLCLSSDGFGIFKMP